MEFGKRLNFLALFYSPCLLLVATSFVAQELVKCSTSVSESTQKVWWKLLC